MRMERREQEVAGPVAGEDAAGAVAAVRGRREPDDQHAGARIAEAGHRPPPVLLVAERRSLLARDLLAPGDEPRARPARDDLAVERGEVIGRRTAGMIRSIRGSTDTLPARCGCSCW